MGFAGGPKYVWGTVLFKLASDWQTLHNDDDEAVAKSAACEIRAMRAVQRAHLPYIRTTLSALLFVRGWVVLATAFAPIVSRTQASPESAQVASIYPNLASRTTLVYGSRDAGETIHNDSKLMSYAISQAADYFHLQEHPVQQDDGTVMQLRLAADVEVSCYVAAYDRRYWPLKSRCC